MRQPTLLAWLAIAGCAASTRAVGGAAAAPAAAGVGGPAAAQPFVDRPPGPIAGTWRVTCPDSQGLLIDISVSGKNAVGRVADPGAAQKFGYQKGEEILKLAADSYGEWVGEVRWRGVSGAQHWDGIRFAATDAGLTATMTNEPCYRSLVRAPR